MVKRNKQLKETLLNKYRIIKILYLSNINKLLFHLNENDFTYKLNSPKCISACVLSQEGCEGLVTRACCIKMERLSSMARTFSVFGLKYIAKQVSHFEKIL